jgi:3-hydroxybutyryl-CoA dehydrogenase
MGYFLSQEKEEDMSRQGDARSTIKTVGIVGSGTMGRRIAFSCIINGKETRLYHKSSEKVQAALKAVRELIEERIDCGRLRGEILEPAMKLLKGVTSLEACVSEVDLVIESVPERLDLKRIVFGEIGRLVDPDTLLCTGTSSIPGSKLADTVKRPDTFFCINFSGPDDLKVEVMGHPLAAQATIDAAMAFVRDIGLVPILVKKEIMGYAYNRVWRAIKKEVLFLLHGGFTTAEDIDRAFMLDWNVPIGPCGLMDEIGLDVIRDIEMNYYNASSDPSDQPPQLLLDMITDGKLGVKSGQGFYTYPDPAYRQPGFLKGDT